MPTIQELYDSLDLNAPDPSENYFLQKLCNFLICKHYDNWEYRKISYCETSYIIEIHIQEITKVFALYYTKNPNYPKYKCLQLS